MFAHNLVETCIGFVAAAVILTWMFIELFRVTAGKASKVIVVVIGAIIGLGVIIGANAVIPYYAKVEESATDDYEMAQELEANGNYLYAYWIYRDLAEQFPDVDELTTDIERIYCPGNYAVGELYMEEGNYYGAMLAFSDIPEYLDARIKADECMMLYLQREHPDWF